MSTFESLTAAQQAQMRNADILLRDAILKSRAALAAMDRYGLAFNSPSFQAALALVDAAELFPSQTGLAGAVAVPMSQFTALQAQFAAILSQWNTTNARQLHADLCGPVNIDGLA